MKRIILAISVFLIAPDLIAASPKVKFIKGNNRIKVVIAGQPFTSYLYGSNLTKPLLVPVRTPSGIEVSRRYPLTEIEGGSVDHEHHIGIFFAVDQVNDVNFWRNTNVPPQIKHVEITEMAGGAGSGKLSAVSHWINDKRQLMLEERRTMVFLAGEHENEYAIDFSIDLTAKCPRVVFEDIEEGMFAIRVSDYLRESGPESSPQPGQPLPNESLSGTGVAILNHPASINYPTYWHVRNYGLFSANPLGQGDFQRQQPKKYRENKVIPLRLTLEQGETAHFRFLVIVYEGFRANEQIEERFKKFASVKGD